MSNFDHYRARLKNAQWSWLECKHCAFHRRNRFKKQRLEGRAEKRSARQLERREREID